MNEELKGWKEEEPLPESVLTDPDVAGCECGIGITEWEHSRGVCRNPDCENYSPKVGALFRRNVVQEPEPRIVNDSLDWAEVTWTAGREVYSPIKYNTFEVGPVSVTVRTRSGETPKQAIARARDEAERAMAEEFERKCRQHLRRIKEADEIVRQERVK